MTWVVLWILFYNGTNCQNKIRNEAYPHGSDRYANKFKMALIPLMVHNRIKFINSQTAKLQPDPSTWPSVRPKAEDGGPAHAVQRFWHLQRGRWWSWGGSAWAKSPAQEESCPSVQKVEFEYCYMFTKVDRNPGVAKQIERQHSWVVTCRCFSPTKVNLLFFFMPTYPNILGIDHSFANYMWVGFPIIWIEFHFLVQLNIR